MIFFSNFKICNISIKNTGFNSYENKQFFNNNIYFFNLFLTTNLHLVSVLNKKVNSYNKVYKIITYKFVLFVYISTINRFFGQTYKNVFS